MDKQKFCIGCKHHRWTPATARCLHPGIPLIGHQFLVTGNQADEIRDHNFCEILRRPDGTCGTEGRLWEPAGETP